MVNEEFPFPQIRQTDWQPRFSTQQPQAALKLVSRRLPLKQATQPPLSLGSAGFRGNLRSAATIATKVAQRPPSLEMVTTQVAWI